METQALHHILLFSNDWCVWAWSQYSVAILAVPSLVAFALKLVAIFHPDVPSDKINDLIKTYWPGGPPCPPGGISP